MNRFTVTLTLAAFAAVALASAPADAQRRICGDRAELLAQLEKRFDGRPQSIGLSADGGLIEVIVSPTRSWTIIITYPKRPSCVMATGEEWHTTVIVGDEA